MNGRQYRLQENPQGFSEICLSFEDDTGTLTYCHRGRTGQLRFGLSRCIPGSLPFYDMDCAAGGMWLDRDTFYIKVHLLDTSVGSLHMEFYFGENDITVFFKKIEEYLFTEFAGHFYGL